MKFVKLNYPIEYTDTMIINTVNYYWISVLIV